MYRKPRRARLLALSLVALCGAACGADSSATGHALSLSWSFIDGRTCTEAGTPHVTVGQPGAGGVVLDCYSGLDHPTYTGQFTAGRFAVGAITVDGSTLYRGEVEMPADSPATLSVVLAYVGGEPAP